MLTVYEEAVSAAEVNEVVVEEADEVVVEETDKVVVEAVAVVGVVEMMTMTMTMTMQEPRESWMMLPCNVDWRNFCKIKGRQQWGVALPVSLPPTRSPRHTTVVHPVSPAIPPLYGTEHEYPSQFVRRETTAGID